MERELKEAEIKLQGGEGRVEKVLEMLKNRGEIGGEGDWSRACRAKELRVWGLAEGIGQREVGGKSGPEWKEALPRMALQQPSHGIP